MKRVPNEPTFVYTTSTSVQVWSLADFLRYYAVESAWSERLYEGMSRMQVSLTAFEPGRSLDLIPDFYELEDETDIAALYDGKPCQAVVDGVAFVRVPMDLRLQHHGDYDDFPGTHMMVWVPDPEKIRNITPWEWTEDGLKITLRMPGEEDPDPDPVSPWEEFYHMVLDRAPGTVFGSPGCTYHSWGIAHVKPGCRCPKRSR